VIVIRNPDAAHDLGLADIQRRDPLDDLLVVQRRSEHPGLLALIGRPLPAGARGTSGEI
jgi:hypothetical protein